MKLRADICVWFCAMLDAVLCNKSIVIMRVLGVHYTLVECKSVCVLCGFRVQATDYDVAYVRLCVLYCAETTVL